METALCKIIPIHLITSGHAYYLGYKWISLGLFVETILSLNYWRYPIAGLRRNLDIIFTYLNFYDVKNSNLTN
jgi:hypothetical protein